MLYNKAILKAREDVKEVSLCYANRAAVYLEIKQFRRCLENIKLAKKGYPNKQKLENRRLKCLKAMKSEKDLSDMYQSPPFELSYEANLKIPFFIDALELKTSAEFGDHLITNENLKAGDVIANIAKPFNAFGQQNILSRKRIIKDIMCFSCFNNCSKTECFSLILGKGYWMDDEKMTLWKVKCEIF